MQAPIHVGIRKGDHELGIDTGLTCIDFKDSGTFPLRLQILFNINKRITLKGLIKIS